MLSRFWGLELLAVSLNMSREIKQMTGEQIHSSPEIHKEHIFEEHITKCLVSEQGYVERVCEDHYNAKLAP